MNTAQKFKRPLLKSRPFSIFKPVKIVYIPKVCTKLNSAVRKERQKKIVQDVFLAISAVTTFVRSAIFTFKKNLKKKKSLVMTSKI